MLDSTSNSTSNSNSNPTGRTTRGIAIAAVAGTIIGGLGAVNPAAADSPLDGPLNGLGSLTGAAAGGGSSSPLAPANPDGPKVRVKPGPDGIIGTADDIIQAVGDLGGHLSGALKDAGDLVKDIAKDAVDDTIHGTVGSTVGTATGGPTSDSADVPEPVVGSGRSKRHGVERERRQPVKTERSRESVPATCGAARETARTEDSKWLDAGLLSGIETVLGLVAAQLGHETDTRVLAGLGDLYSYGVVLDSTAGSTGTEQTSVIGDLLSLDGCGSATVARASSGANGRTGSEDGDADSKRSARKRNGGGHGDRGVYTSGGRHRSGGSRIYDQERNTSRGNASQTRNEGSSGSAILRVARSKAGAPYAYGAAGPGSFDCSGYTQWVFRHFRKALPHNSGAQVGSTRRIPFNQRRPGDLVFFYDGGGVYHVGIYAGSGTIWHAPYTGARVRRERIWTSSVFYGRVR